MSQDHFPTFRRIGHAIGCFFRNPLGAMRATRHWMTYWIAQIGFCLALIIRRAGHWCVRVAPRRIGRWCVRVAPKVGFGLLVLFVLVAIPWTYFNIKWGRELEARLAELKAQGMPLTMVEAAPEPVPDSQNAAVLYQKVFKVQFPPAKPTVLEGSMGGLSAQELESFYEYLKDPNPELEAEVRALLARDQVQQALEILRRGSERPYSVFPVNWEDGAGAVFPHMGRIRAAAVMCAVNAQVLAKAHHVGEALDWCQVALRMSEHAAQEPTIIGQLVAVTMQSIIFNVMRGLLSNVDIAPATATDIDHSLTRFDLHTSYRQALKTEVAYSCWAFETLRTSPDMVQALLAHEAHTVSPLYFTCLARPIHKLDQLRLLNYWEHQVTLLSQPYRTVHERLRELYDALEKEPAYLVLTRRFFPQFSRATQKRDVGVANIGLCRVALALKAYKYERGAYPDSLDRLEQTLDWQLPEDPFSGKDFVYRRHGEGFKLYSIGQDLEDDGGLPERDEEGKWRDDADIVWECSS